MKLVDILARELTEWAGDVGAITQNKLTGELLDYYHCPLRGGNEREVSSIADDAGEAHDGASGAAVTRAEWQAAVDALKSDLLGYSPAMHAQRVGRVDRFVAWDGKGFPPIGAVVHTDHKRKEMTVKILAYGDHHKDRCVLVADMSHGAEGKMFGWIAPQCVFRPIKTAEQIAAELEAQTVKEIAQATGLRAGAGQMEVARALYAAGYRKKVAP